PAGSRDQRGQDLDGYVGSQEMDRSVRKHCVSPASVEAVELTVVGAVDGARSRFRLPVERRTLNGEGVIESCPATADDDLVFAWLPYLPRSRPAGILSQQEGVGGAVLNISDAS